MIHICRIGTVDTFVFIVSPWLSLVFTWFLLGFFMVFHWFLHGCSLFFMGSCMVFLVFHWLLHVFFIVVPPFSLVLVVFLDIH